MPIVLPFDMHWKSTVSSYSNQYFSALSVEMKVAVISGTDVSLKLKMYGLKPQNQPSTVFACIFMFCLGDGWWGEHYCQVKMVQAKVMKLWLEKEGTLENRSASTLKNGYTILMCWKNKVLLAFTYDSWRDIEKRNRTTRIVCQLENCRKFFKSPWRNQHYLLIY